MTPAAIFLRLCMMAVLLHAAWSLYRREARQAAFRAYREKQPEGDRWAVDLVEASCGCVRLFVLWPVRVACALWLLAEGIAAVLS